MLLLWIKIEAIKVIEKTKANILTQVNFETKKTLLNYYLIADFLLDPKFAANINLLNTFQS